MGSPDGTKIVLGLIVSTSAVVVTYILLKKYGLRALRRRTEENEYEGDHHVSEKELPISSEALKDQRHGDLASLNADDAGLKRNEGNEANNAVPEDGRDDVNQTSFIMLGATKGRTSLPESENGAKKSDRSSDESSYDVIEDDRLADTIEDDDDEKNHGGEVNASGKTLLTSQVYREGQELESLLETSIVMVEAERSNVEKSDPSFYASADENFGASPFKDNSAVPDMDKESPAQGILDVSVTEDEEETTVMYKSATVGNESVFVEHEKVEVTEELEDKDGKDKKTEESSSSHVDNPVVQEQVEALALTDAVLRADLKATSPVTESETKVSPNEGEIDPSQVTEVLNKCQNMPMNVSKQDIDLLVLLLCKNVPELRATVLNSIVRVAAFNQNTTQLRDSGCPEEIVRQLKETCAAVEKNEPGAETTLTSINQVLTNLSLDPKAHPKLEESIPALIDLLLMESPSDSLILSTLRPLVNLSGEAPYHTHYIRVVPRLLMLLESGSHMVKVQSLKVLVNISLGTEIVPHLLAAEAPPSLMALLVAPTHNDVILRCVTLLANIFTASKEGTVSSQIALRDGGLYKALTEEEQISNLRSKVLRLTMHEDEDIRFQSSKLLKFIAEPSD